MEKAFVVHRMDIDVPPGWNLRRLARRGTGPTPLLTSPIYFFTISNEMARSTLTDFELMILLAIMRVGESAYGVPIAREIEETGRRSVAIAAVYAALERLEERGLVRSSLGDSTPERGGRAKKFFQVTGAGMRLVREAHEGLTAMWRGLSVLKGRA